MNKLALYRVSGRKANNALTLNVLAETLHDALGKAQNDLTMQQLEIYEVVLIAPVDVQ